MEVGLVPPVWDLKVRFDAGLVLVVSGGIDDEPQSWFLLGPGNAKLVAGPGSRLTTQHGG